MTQEEIETLTGRKTPYTKVLEYDKNTKIDWDDVDSWYYLETLGTEFPALRPQKRVYRIISRDGKPTGRIVYADNEVHAAALRQEVRDAKGKTYIWPAELVDVIFND